MKEQNEFMIQLAKLEEELLENLSNADPDTILDNKELIISLETTKATSIEIAEKILRQELSNPKAQSEVVEKLVSDLNLN